jgi:hypothetical protein
MEKALVVVVAGGSDRVTISVLVSFYDHAHGSTDHSIFVEKLLENSIDCKIDPAFFPVKKQKFYARPPHGHIRFFNFLWLIQYAFTTVITGLYLLLGSL